MKYVTWYKIVNYNGAWMKDSSGVFLPLIPNEFEAKRIRDTIREEGSEGCHLQALTQPIQERVNKEEV